MTAEERWKSLLAREEERGPAATILGTFTPPGAKTHAARSSPSLRATRIEWPEGTATLPPADPLPATQAAPHEPELRVVDKIGEGGMGVVYRAVQSALEREVALKETRSQDARSRELFLSEARLTGQLDHANIVPIHALGQTPAGNPYLVLKLIEGTDWRELLHTEAGAGLELKDHFKVLLSVCNAVAFAHERGIIHRDLKPENVMVGRFGQVFVMDWGLAVRLQEGPDGRRCALGADETAGTPAYMAPELALGEGERQDERTDVYLLGACLHEVLTRTPRHEGDSVYKVLTAAMDSPPFEYDETVPSELAAICNRATSVEPADRYPDVPSLAQAIEAYLEHEQARVITKKALEQLERLKHERARWRDATPAEREEIEHTIHQLHGETSFAFGHALEVWAEADEARIGQRELTELMLDHALETEDLALARRLIADGPDRRAEVDALQERLEARARELEALREAAAQRDWSRLGPPLGTLLMVAGVFVGLGATISGIIRHQLTDWNTPLVKMTVWVIVCAIVGTTAIRQFRLAKGAQSLVSVQTLGTWGAIAVAAVLLGTINRLVGLPPFRLLGGVALLVGIGIAALAFQTRLWLLLPAAAFYGASIAMAAYPGFNHELLGALIFVALGGVGVALKLGASLVPPGQESEQP